MDAQNHKKASASEHESHGVHSCHKCNWPFPNPNPSAKHRRAHKKFCGKIEGYKIIASETGTLSDDEHLSDDDLRTPSPKMEKSNEKEHSGSDETALKISKSEDEAFSDAVTEFSDSWVTSSVEDRRESVEQLNNNVGKQLLYDSIDDERSKGSGTDGPTEVLDNPTQDSEILNSEAGGYATVQPQNTEPISNIRVQEVSLRVDSIDVPGSRDGLVDSVVPAADRKTSATETLEPMLQEADQNIPHTAPDCEIVGQEKELSGKLFAETRNMNFEPFLSEADGNNFSTVGKTEQDNGLTDMSLADVTKNDLSSQNEPPINSDGNETTEIKEDSAMDKIEHGHDKLAEVNDSKGEGYEETHVVSVSESLQGVEHPELMIQDFKDYKVLKSSFPLDLGDADLTTPGENEKKVTVSETDSSYISSIHVGSLTSCHSDANSLDNLEKGALASIGREVDPSAQELINEEDSVTKGFKTLNSPSNSSPEGFKHDSTDEKSSKYGVSALSTMALSDVIPSMSSIDEETTPTTKVETTDDNVIGKSEHVKTESRISDTLILHCKVEANAEASQGLEMVNNNEIAGSKCVPSVASEFCPQDQSISSDEQSKTVNIEAQRSTLEVASDLNPEDRSVVSDENLEDFMHKELATLPVASAVANQSSAATEDRNVRDSLAPVSLVDEDDKCTAERLNVADNSVVSSSRTESLEGNWGSVSVLSIQSDGTTRTDAAILFTGTKAPEKSDVADVNPQTAVQGYHTDRSDAFEPPSFMSLVESGVKLDKTAMASEVHTVQKTESPKADALQAGWLPSITKVVNESEGRKKNEEIIAKVTNWNSGQQHSPLKILLSEAHAETKARTGNKADETTSKNNGATVTTVSSIMGSEMPVHEAAKTEMEMEWKSPARYPAEIKKEKKKGKPYWIPFVCCTSIQQDM